MRGAVILNSSAHLLTDPFVAIDVPTDACAEEVIKVLVKTIVIDVRTDGVITTLMSGVCVDAKMCDTDVEVVVGVNLFGAEMTTL